ncbi:cell division protein FtsB [Neptuniibacter sp. CAU 1671]|uniref:cell division protein FtsB n=1 Tax=Neptuniibacter sp. CAU 1671 TaxID=3032593 RepID=UPI0023DA4EA4|nr:cell division protein FtsB [Neptuniibacter sp. CAU 1671]MDF2181783.1 cell division protein FtsB [Neptuniibacter sp. CAU 1671]
MFRWVLLLILLLFAGLQYRLWLGEANLRETWQLKAQIEQQVLDNARLIQRNSELEAEVKDLKRGLSAIEERARSELGMIREGETFIQLVEPVPQKEKR